MEEKERIYMCMRSAIKKALEKNTVQQVVVLSFLPKTEPRQGLFGPLLDRLLGPKVLNEPIQDDTRDALKRFLRDGFKVHFRQSKSFRKAIVDLDTVPEKLLK